MAAAFCGKWTKASADNYETMLDALGMPADRRAAFLGGEMTIDIKVEGDKWTLTTVIAGQSREDTFTVGVETEAPSVIDGTPTKFTMTFDGTTLSEVSRSEKRETSAKRYIQGGQLVMEYTYGDVTGTMRFNKS